MPPFVIFALPRSRTAWLSRFLTYGDYVCGHDEIKHMRSMADLEMWFDQPCIGTVETMAAPWWRTLARLSKNVRVVVVRRPVSEVVDSLLAMPGMVFDRAVAEAMMTRLDRKLEQIGRRVPGALTVDFADLAREDVCAEVFEHCLPYAHDPDHWAAIARQNIQINMSAVTRYVHAYMPALDKLASIATQHTLTALSTRKPVNSDAFSFHLETFDNWLSEGQSLIEAHLAVVNEPPDNWQRKNLTLMRELHDAGVMQIMSARSNGKMYGYLMTMILPSLTAADTLTGVHGAFYASPDAPGLGAKLQRAALQELKKRGVDEVFFEAGSRGSGPRLSALYKRLGAQDHGRVFRMELVEG